jgi:cysteine-rich repeat protein
MRGILVAVACVVVGGCDSSGIGDPSTGTHGNGIVDEGEECDDGNSNDCDGCKSNCTWARALHVDGGDLGATVEEGSIPCLPCPFTIEAWFKMDDDGGSWDLYDIPPYTHCTFGALAFDNSTFMGGTADSGFWEGFVPGTWHHFAVSCWYSGGSVWTQASLIDGQPIGGTSSGEHLPLCTGTMTIGGALSSPSGGSMDDLRFSNQALYIGLERSFSPSRHLSVRSDTVALWDFDEVVDGRVPDVSGNGHDAVLVDGTLVSDGCHLP